LPEYCFHIDENFTLAHNPISLINPGLKAGATDIYSFQEK